MQRFKLLRITRGTTKSKLNLRNLQV
uniref:Uncharacterized protein n=1 Tax=Rhizophora mucronata TaxID=61149 RepID=A0A2P2PSQ4_RHIMU